MKRRPDPTAAADLEASLARLGVRELEERMELSPLLTAGDVQDSDACECSCSCDVPWDPILEDTMRNMRMYAGPAY